MHFKNILFITILSLSAGGALAQPVAKRAPRSVDTIVVAKYKPTLPVNKLAGPTYKPVPLAGQQSYFGDMNEYVTNFVRQYLSTHNKTLNVVQQKTNSFSLIDNVLEKNNIPKELKYLAVIESALNHNAVSHAGAVGPWQFMEGTAKLMGLTVNRKRDDRRDLYKSTGAAAKYLSILYEQLNDWLLVIAAYNSGPGVVQRAIERTGSNNFWDIKKYLPRETQGHVLAFIATASIFENLSNFISTGALPTDFSFDPKVEAAKLAKKDPPKVVFTAEELSNMAIVRVSEPVNMDLMAHELGIDIKLLNRWNPDYELFIYNTYSSETYNLHIPKDKLENFIQKKEYLQKRSKAMFSEMNM